MPNPAIVSDEAIQALNAVAYRSGISKQLLDLIHLRASRIWKVWVTSWGLRTIDSDIPGDAEFVPQPSIGAPRRLS